MNASIAFFVAAAALSVTAEESGEMITVPVTMPVEKALECRTQTCILVTEDEVYGIFHEGVKAGAAGCRRSVL